MRTFIAIELPKEIRDALSRIQETLKKSQADVKWVEPQNIHLTLKFLGDIDERKQRLIEEIIGQVAVRHNSFRMRPVSVGAFPKINYPRVIWVGISEGGEESKELAKELEERIAKIGIPKEERAFSSHITIARVRSGMNREALVQVLNNLQDEPQKANLGFQVKEITLYKSTLTPKGPFYEPLKKLSLKTS